MIPVLFYSYPPARRLLMLVITRSLGENILIGEDVIISVASIGKDSVRLGILAPEETRVDREEIRERIRKNGEDPRRPLKGGLGR
jgi:carbon storage regulator